MIQITQEEGITVLITTHYIEETKDANKVSVYLSIKLILIISMSKLVQNILQAFLKNYSLIFFF